MAAGFAALPFLSSAPPATTDRPSLVVDVETHGGDLMVFEAGRRAIREGRRGRLTAVRALVRERDGLGNETPRRAVTFWWRADALGGVNWSGIREDELIALSDPAMLEVHTPAGLHGLVSWCRDKAGLTPDLCAEVRRRIGR